MARRQRRAVRPRGATLAPSWDERCSFAGVAEDCGAVCEGTWRYVDREGFRMYLHSGRETIEFQGDD